MIRPISTSHVPRDAAKAVTNYRTIQALRAVAALLVVLLHCNEMWDLRIDANAAGSSWTNGQAGVDIFFVISGFIMTVSSRRLINERRGWIAFLKHRVVRIVPLYWILTTVKLLAVVVAGGLVLRSQLNFGFVAASYLFLPLVDSVGHFRPLLPVGWTLTFEFIFYIIFSIALAWRVDALRVVLPVLGTMTLVALIRTERWPVWTLIFDPIVFEFMFGIAVAKLMLKDIRFPPAIAVCVLIAGFVLLLSIAPTADNLRVLVWGLPATAIVAAAVSLERVLGHAIPKWLLLMGDASYSLYLSHGFFLAALGISIGFVDWSGPYVQIASIIVGMFGSSLVSVWIYWSVERPLLRALR